MSKIMEGETVLILTEGGKRYLVGVRSGKKFHCSEGYLDMGELVGREYGCVVKSNTGVRMTVHKPLLMDLLSKVRRVTQIVYPKDIGYMIVQSGIGPGSRVLEAGTGTGVLAATLAHHIKPTGKVYSYDVNQDYLEAAHYTLERLGLREYVELKYGDVAKDVTETDVDAAFLDVPEPWKAVESVWRAMRPSGRLLSLSPTVEQIVEMVETLRSSGFDDISCVEILMREMRVKRGMTRPEFLMRGHTAYIVSARKTGIN
ncbi:MAG: tRNA (adenine-N1)-methyltransferase [Nitrososphaerota archaeon]